MLFPNSYASFILTSCGTLEIFPVNVVRDSDLIHSWITHPQSSFWGALDSSLDEVRNEYSRIFRSSFEAAWLVGREGQPLALVETYSAGSILKEFLSRGIPADAIGMHILVKPLDGPPEHGLTDCIFAAVVRWLFDVQGSPSIVVEPDRSNHQILRKNFDAGFTDVPGLTSVKGEFSGVYKTARFQVCKPEHFRSSRLAGHASARVLPNTLTEKLPARALSPLDYAASHLRLHGEMAANSQLAKALREFIHERLLDAVPTESGNSEEYSVRWGSHTLAFRARRHQLDHLSIQPDSIRFLGGAPVSLSTLIKNSASELGMPQEFVNTYISEVQATVATQTRALSRPRPSSAVLADCPAKEDQSVFKTASYFQFVESSMLGGHPGFVANAGRGGMSELELESFVPELGESFQVVWLAARRETCVTATSSSLPSIEGALPKLLGHDMAAKFRGCLEGQGLKVEDYLPLPVHPWQWDNKIVNTFAEDIIAKRLVFVGPGTELYHPQQSLRTLFCLSEPSLPYVKTATAVRNMGFTRGLSPEYMKTTPAINDWLEQLLGDDVVFRESNARLLPEIASIGYVGDVYHSNKKGSAIFGNTPEQKMLAALWRQSPIPLLQPGCVAVTMASILHLDASGIPLLREFINKSRRTPEDWVAALMKVYLRPIIRALAEYSVVFMPHTENIILELNDGFPVGSFFKDLGEEVAVVDATRKLPPTIERVQVDDGSMTAEQRALSIHTDVIDGVFRHVAALADDFDILPEETFWNITRDTIMRYEEDFPGTLERLPLLAESFPHSCLNRLQLRNPVEMVNLGDQSSSLLYAGRMKNPLHRK
ncbi:GNAT family N-acetyltransferase [Corynebacterium sp. TAE3-ERU12]|uniref:GNAT family N-acetyltransferase n=1 Tax=Corynebacterium sp. TAE3-ERU12 TaxID=2849491 RepID=UPI001C46B8C7|nr:GNAT family N-acetyltransferase [Corynebacterium sp. TAE3-ERU12]MBV7294624.1 GNAT family N-acetyltransferase [Corynebacterium sp. TAE3-ERU12]